MKSRKQEILYRLTAESHKTKQEIIRFANSCTPSSQKKHETHYENNSQVPCFCEEYSFW
jgi:hypothetical protein